MSGDGVSINKQAASNALSDWDHGADHADGQFKAQAKATSGALDKGNWIGDDDAGKAFRSQFDVSTIDEFLTGGKQYGGNITDGIKKLGQKARDNVERSLRSDEQQRQEMDKANRKASARDNGSSPSSSGPSSAKPSSAAPTSAGSSATANHASGSDAAAKAKNAVSPAKTHPELFKGPLQWGIEGSDGKWHPLPAHADLKAKEYQGPLQWGVEGSDGKWYPLPANEHPTSIDDRGPLMHLMPASNEPTATDDRGPLMHIMPATFTSEVVGQHGHLTTNPVAGQQWHGEAAQSAEMVNAYQPDPSAIQQGGVGHAAVTSGRAAPAAPTPVDTHREGTAPVTTSHETSAPQVYASGGTLQEGGQHAAVTSGETAPAQPIPVEHHREGAEPPRKS